MGPIGSAALKVALSGGGVGLVLFKTRRFTREQMGLVRPPLPATLLFILALLGWMLATDALIHWRGPWNWQPWIHAPIIASAMRVIAVCGFGPALEELIFRGWAFALLQPRVGATLTIVATAVSWAALHYTYGWLVIAVIVVDGLLLGLARWRTGSVFAPIFMHMLYNLYAIW